MSGEVELPASFAHLESFAATWDLEGADQRALVRVRSSKAELTALYEAVLPCLDAILEHLAQFEMGSFPPPERRLFRLLLGLCEASMVIEIFHQPGLPCPEGRIAFSVLRPLPPV